MSRAAPRALAVFAHPDDETFGIGGTLARAVEAGWKVTAVSATRGEVGEIADPALATPETLGEQRESELRAACDELGVADVRFLGYRDSGMAGTPENADPRAYANADSEEVTGRLVEIMREVEPDAVFTFDERGGYGHPDHIAIHRHAAAAFGRAARPGARLWFSAIPRGVLRQWAEEMRRNNIEGLMTSLDPEVGVADEEITAAVDVTPWIDAKRRAIAAHATQVPDWMRALPAERRAAMFAREYFILGAGDAAKDPLALA
ncbi:MAG: PIG-L family deacetylase [Chloroflexota bacterium]|nr:PIG-L family deacetylase [Chloroflexota bacterium]